MNAAAIISSLEEAYSSDGFVYHGTPDVAKAEAIMADGLLKPGAIKQGRGQLSPLAGRTYYTTSLAYATMYALGGNMAGSEYPEQYWRGTGRYGYLFAVPEADLADILPDEDSVGEFITNHSIRDGSEYKCSSDDPAKVQMWHRLKSLMTPNQFSKAAWGEFSYASAGGKRALKSLTPSEREQLLGWGAHLAAAGTAKPVACWKLDKGRSAELAEDGSNFFEIAELVFDHR